MLRTLYTHYHSHTFAIRNTASDLARAMRAAAETESQFITIEYTTPDTIYVVALVPVYRFGEFLRQIKAPEKRARTHSRRRTQSFACPYAGSDKGTVSEPPRAISATSGGESGGKDGASGPSSG